MAKVQIAEKGCRGCTLCVDVCPVDVFAIDKDEGLAVVAREQDCIGCLSCLYSCPSRCIDVTDIPRIKPFHRIEKDVVFIRQFLQTPDALGLMNQEEITAACGEVGLLITSFSAAISEILGRGHRSVGRRAGTVAVAHLPQMYEQREIHALLKSMQERLGAGFNFTYTITDAAVNIDVQQCGLLKPLCHAGYVPGESDVCLLFHEYWAGLVSAFMNVKYECIVKNAGESCSLMLSVKDVN